MYNLKEALEEFGSSIEKLLDKHPIVGNILGAALDIAAVVGTVVAIAAGGWAVGLVVGLVAAGITIVYAANSLINEGTKISIQVLEAAGTGIKVPTISIIKNIDTDANDGEKIAKGIEGAVEASLHYDSWSDFSKYIQSIGKDSNLTTEEKIMKMQEVFKMLQIRQI